MDVLPKSAKVSSNVLSLSSPALPALALLIEIMLSRSFVLRPDPAEQPMPTTPTQVHVILGMLVREDEHYYYYVSV